MTLRVMLIDDHPVVRAGLRAVLNSFGDMEVVAEAADGDADVPEGVDVVVSDIQMPGASGIDLTRRLVKAGGPPFGQGGRAAGAHPDHLRHTG